MALPHITPLATERVTIRGVQETDLPDLHAVNGDPAVTVFLPYETWTAPEHGTAWLARMDALAATGTARQFVLEMRTSGTVVGTLLLFRYDEGSARAELGYALARRHWGQGVMREALRAFCGHLFATAGLRRLEAEVNPSNQASNRLLRALGFTLEGTLRKRWVGKGTAYDTHVYGLLREECS